MNINLNEDKIWVENYYDQKRPQIDKLNKTSHKCKCNVCGASYAVELSLMHLKSTHYNGLLVNYKLYCRGPQTFHRTGSKLKIMQ